MRTHFLSRLPLVGREIALTEFPDFDFYCLTRVRSFSMCEHIGSETLYISLTVDYEAGFQNKVGEVVLRFEQVRHVKFPEFTPHFFLSEVEVEDISSDQIEGVKYRTRSCGDPELEILSGDIRIQEARRM